MIGNQPMAVLAPLEYRYALDVAALALGQSKVLIRCEEPMLQGEATQRITNIVCEDPDAGIWIEPVADGLKKAVSEFSEKLRSNAQLLIIASGPLALMLPQRQRWTAKPLGVNPTGLFRMTKSLRKANFTIEASYGTHSLTSIALNTIAEFMVKGSRPDLADQLRAASRLHYCTSGPLAALATVALLFGRRA